MTSARIFPKWSERINLAMPFVVAVFLITFAKTAQSIKYYENWLALISGVLFLNTIHTIFSFFFICFLKEFRAAVAEKYEEEGAFFFVKIIGVFVGFFSFCLSAHLFGSDGYIFTLTQVAQLAAVHHGMMQIHGLSKIYDNEVDVREKWLYRLFFATFALAHLAISINAARFDTTAFRFLWAGLTFISPACLLAISMQKSNGVSNQTLFVARNFLRPLGFLCHPFMLISQFTHGIEYLFVINRVVEKSRYRMTWIAGLLLVAAASAVSLFHFALHFGPVLTVSSATEKLAIDVLASFSVATFMTHFYLDRVFFKMSDAIMRKNIAPLLKPANLEEEETEPFLVGDARSA